MYNTTGDHCELCLPGYEGSALHRNCTAISKYFIYAGYSYCIFARMDKGLYLVHFSNMKVLLEHKSNNNRFLCFEPVKIILVMLVLFEVTIIGIDSDLNFCQICRYFIVPSFVGCFCKNNNEPQGMGNYTLVMGKRCVSISFRCLSIFRNCPTLSWFIRRLLTTVYEG